MLNGDILSFFGNRVYFLIHYHGVHLFSYETLFIMNNHVVIIVTFQKCFNLISF